MPSTFLFPRHTAITLCTLTSLITFSSLEQEVLLEKTWDDKEFEILILLNLLEQYT